MDKEDRPLDDEVLKDEELLDFDLDELSLEEEDKEAGGEEVIELVDLVEKGPEFQTTAEEDLEVQKGVDSDSDQIPPGEQESEHEEGDLAETLHEESPDFGAGLQPDEEGVGEISEGELEDALLEKAVDDLDLEIEEEEAKEGVSLDEEEI
ncbi:MAG: hypothetical protein JRJ01_03510 [Deltaproteobacteria bacterium]|nr:hypothetical protein [Deltaproteobacteria bacterium]